jgi:hypothetical protein
VSPPLEPDDDLELDFDIDEAAAPIDLADLAAEEISDEEALSTSELHAEVAPLPPRELSREDSPQLDLSNPWDELPPLALAPPAPPAPPDSFADLFREDRTAPVLELQPEVETQPPELEVDGDDSPFRLDADPLPFKPFGQTPSLEAEDAGPRPFELEVDADADAVPLAPAPLAAAPPIALDADEAVLREVLSRASRDTIERVVWEVVPQLAETMIREQLERLMKDRKNP